MPEVASQTLDFVGRELNVTLTEARTALEGYVEQQGNPALLERCGQELHRVQGVLRVLEIYGGALLAEEMEQVTAYLLAMMAEKKNPAESLDALMRAMVQLPSYLERVLAGGRDLALVLLPLLNDLRAVRGSSLLSEGTLLLLNLKSDQQAQPTAVAAGETPMTVEQWARRLRPRYQVGLIGWIRGERVEQNLDILAGVAKKLEQIATRQPVFQLWWVIGAIIEALREHGIESGVSVKRLLGLGDREIRRVYEQGEARYAQSPPVELLNNLLYYVGRSDSSGPRVMAVRASFRLSELLPVDESIEQERENLSAPSVKLMQTVAVAIREDLSKVKDVLDIFVRRGAGQPKELAPQVELLRKIGDTLGVLGLGELRANVQAQTERLDRIVAGTLLADEPTLVEIAAALIGVEDRLDDSLVGLIRPKSAGVAEYVEDAEFQQVQAAVLRECILNLARVKEAVSQNVGGTLDAAGLDSWQALMRGLKAGLLMLGKPRAVEVIEGITGQLKRVMQPGGRALPAGFMDRLADAIVSVEYYMETLQSGRSDPWYMLDNAQACVQTLEQQQTPSVPTVPPLEPAAFARTVQISNPTLAFGVQTEPTAAVGATAPTLSASQNAAIAALAESADPELVKLFIEEAHEELVKIARHFPTWDQNPLARESLLTVRRSFHTLKGSGRMVGARDLGEFAWSVENLLNRILDNTLSRSPQILEVLREAVAALPEIIEQLETGRLPRADVQSISSRAHALAAGRPPSTSATTRIANLHKLEQEALQRAEAASVGPTESLTPIAPDAPVAEQPTGQAPDIVIEPPPIIDVPLSPVQIAQPAPDEVLREIYARETGAHIATIRAYLEREEAHPEPHAITEDVYRACHTLSGSSKMAQARHGIRLAEPLDHWLRRVFDSGLGLQTADLSLLSDSMLAMESVATHLDESTGYFLTHTGLEQRISQAETLLEQRIAAARATTQSPPAENSEPELAADANVVVPAGDAAQSSIEPEVAPEIQPAVEPEVEPDYEDGDFDPEVAAIFTEEALELLDAAEQALSEWRSEPANADYRSAIKRPLHTLKGGARMAGITAMGDLSHELETLVMLIDNGTVAADGPVFDVVQGSLDELARMREAVANGRRVPSARATIARIQSLSRPAPAASAGPPAASAAAFLAVSAAEPSPEPSPEQAPSFERPQDEPLSGHLTPEQPAPIDTGATSDPWIEPTSPTAETSPDQPPSFERPPDEPRWDYLTSEQLAPVDTVVPPEPWIESAPRSPEPWIESAPLAPEPWIESPPQDLYPAPVSEAVDSALVESTFTDGDGAERFAPPSPPEEYLAPQATQDETRSESPESQPVVELIEAVVELLEAVAEPAINAIQPTGAAPIESSSETEATLESGWFSGPPPEPSGAIEVEDSDSEEIVLSADDLAASQDLQQQFAEFSGREDSGDGSNEAALDFIEPFLPTPDPFAPVAVDDAFAQVSVELAPATAQADSPDVEPTDHAAEYESANSETQSEAAPRDSEPEVTRAATVPESPQPTSVAAAYARLSAGRDDDSIAPPIPVPPGREPVAPAERVEMARVDADLLDQLLNVSGEASIARSRLEQQLGSIDFNLGELSRTVIRLKDQLRSLEIETEAQILHRHEDEGGHRGDFDPLELDRYSSIQQFSRALAETANDVASIQQLLENLAKDTQNILQQQARTITELQNGLMRTRMVPFQRHVQRLARIVRQAAADTGKRAELIVEGATGELDRQVLERMLPPFEHMLRNAVVHGIEMPEERVRNNKPEVGRIVLELHREGAEVMVRLTDDGAGMNLNAIRAKGVALGLVPTGRLLSDEDAMQLILEPGFSTAGTITQQAGRGVGMDVVATEIKRLGGALHMESKVGEGTTFTIRLPFTLAISHALVVRTGEEFYALPLPTVEGVLRLSKAEVTAHLGREAAAFEYGGQRYRFQHLATFVSLEPSPLPEQDVTIPVVLVRAGEHSTGLIADELVGSREIVVKSVGPQISSIRGISGATILGDGRIVIILDIGALVRAEWRGRPQGPVVAQEKTDKRTFVMVVDDSITVRRVTQRLLERNGMRVLTARDGMDAVALLQDNVPDIILLDIEMPRMDGYEVAAHVRHDPRLKDVPIIMITSRVGEKHRARAIELGVDDYLGKPYQEAQLLDAISPLVERSRAARDARYA